MVKSDMDSDVDAKVLKEIETTNRLILKRLTEVANKETSCAYTCHSKDPERELELENLKQRHRSLENREHEKDEQLKVLKSQLNKLTETLDTILRPQIAQQANVGGDILPYSTEEVDKGQQPPVVYAYHASIEHDKSETTVKDCPTALNDNLLGAGELDDSELGVAASVKAVQIDRGNGAFELDKPETEIQDSTLEKHDKSGVGPWLSYESPSRSDDIKECNEKGKQSPLLSKTCSEDSSREAISNIRRKTDYLDDNSDGAELGESQCGKNLNEVQMHLYEDKSINSPIFRSGREVLDITSITGMGETLQTVSKHGEQQKHISPIEMKSGTAQAEDTYVEGSESDSITSGDNKHADANSTGLNKAGLGTETRIAVDTQGEKTDSSVNATKGKNKSDAVTNRKSGGTDRKAYNRLMMSASRKQMQGHMSELATYSGVCTIVCVDISYSMTKGNAWEQAKTFFNDFIGSLKHSMNRFNITEESVALVTFGHKTKVLKRFTNDFSSLQMSFDGISLGGPSPMYGGLLMCTAAVQSTSCASAFFNNIPILTKCVLITDGYPTDTNLVAGPDELTPTEQEDTNSQILEMMQQMEGSFDVFCVPVGNANMEFLHLMVSVSDGKLITYKDGEKIGSRLRKTVKAGGGIPSRFNDNGSDDEDINDILEDAARRSNHRKLSNYLENKTDQLPQIGSRDRRGPDWKLDDQDRNVSGTVIGHASNGKNWQQTTRNGNFSDRGNGTKTLSEEHVWARWLIKDSYRLNRPLEVEFSPPEVPFPIENNMYVSRSHGAQEYVPRLQQGAVAQSQAIQPNRIKNKKGVNKNKNVANKNKNAR